jgi:hypothetical protein
LSLKIFELANCSAPKRGGMIFFGILDKGYRFAIIKMEMFKKDTILNISKESG